LTFVDSSALAAKQHLPLGIFGSAAQPSFGDPLGLAVDQSNGDLLVIDKEARAISRYHADGTPDDFSALGTNVIDGKSGPDETPQAGLTFGNVAEVQLAVDSSGGVADGDIYVTQSGNHLIDIFAADGTYLGQLTESSEGSFGEACGVAVDPSGSVYVGDFNGKIHKFTPTTNPPTTTDNVTNFSFGQACALAAGVGPTAGYLFASHFEGPVAKLDSSTGAVQYTVAGGEHRAVVVDPGSGHVYLVNEQIVEEYDASGVTSATAVSSISADSEIRGVAVDGTDGDIYLDRYESPRIEVFGPLVTVPTAVTGQATGVGREAATLSGEVNPEGLQLTECAFEYGRTDSYGMTVPCSQSPAQIGGGEEFVKVGVVVGGLTQNTFYHFRLVVSNPEATAHGEDNTFSTEPAPPVVEPETCPNAALRPGASSRLPDCRAYEQVTPVEKNGANPIGNADRVQAAIGGSAITYLTDGGIPGSEGAQANPSFLASRSERGWSGQGLLPPAGGGSSAAVLGWSEDLAFTYADQGERPFSPATLYQRDSASRALRPIASGGGAVNENGFSYDGTAASGSKVLFESPSALLPGAAAGATNLYLWDRTTGAVSLAGSLNDRAAPPEGAFAGANGPFSSRTYTQAMHAISADGSRVFFSAGGSGELYLRENPTQPQSPLDSEGSCANPTLACTVDLSASEKTNGLGPGGVASNAPQPATFVAATPDGSRAFFTSSEELTDDASTGPEPPAPELGRAELDGSEAERGFISTLGRWLAIDGSHVYWSNSSAGTIGRAQLDGSEIEPGYISGLSHPQGLAVDGNRIFWAEDGEGNEGEGTVGRATLGVAGPEEVEPRFITGADDPQGVAVLDEPGQEYIYWTNLGNTDIGRAKLDGSEVDQSFIARLAGEKPGGIAVDSTNLFWTDLEGGTTSYAVKTNLSGGSESFTHVSGVMRQLAIDPSYVYWTSESTGSIGRMTLGFTGKEEGFVSGIDKPLGIAADPAHIYWSANTEPPASPGNDLYEYDVARPAGERLIDLSADHEASDPNGAEVQGVLGTSDDGTYVYFAANGVLAAGAERGNCTGSTPGSDSGACSLYLWHEGVTTFVARLRLGGAASDSLNWFNRFSEFNARGERTARVSADGRSLLFRSQRRLTEYDNEGQAELYLYRDGTVRCVSCDPSGAPPLGPASLQDIQAPAANRPGPAGVLTRNLSADGDRVFFESPDPLVSADVNGSGGCPFAVATGGGQEVGSCQDVYEWEAPAKGGCTEGSSAYSAAGGGCLYLISTGSSPDPSYFADASASGGDVFIFTSERLVGQDRDQLTDIYDARVDGGLASQDPALETPCAGDACKGSAAATPASGAPGSSSFHGAGNLPRRPNCHKSGRSARKLRHRAKRLRRNSARVSSRSRAMHLNHKARRLVRRAQRQNSRAKHCRGQGKPASHTRQFGRRVRNNSRHARRAVR
jgi:hypothetical protein